MPISKVFYLPILLAHNNLWLCTIYIAVDGTYYMFIIFYVCVSILIKVRIMGNEKA